MKGTDAERKQREYEEQEECIAWLASHYPKQAERCFAVCNEFSGGVGGRVKRKKKGVRAGVPDLWHLIRTNYSALLVVEFKATPPFDARLSVTQAEWLVRIREMGGVAVCVKGINDYKKVISRYFDDEADLNEEWERDSEVYALRAQFYEDIR